MPKILQQTDGKRILIDVLIPEVIESKLSEDGKTIPTNINAENGIWCKALVDTGATMSVISQKIVDKFDLKSVSMVEVSTASSSRELVNQYKTMIGIKLVEGHRLHPINKNWEQINQIKLHPIMVAGNKHIQHQGFDVIIGMDIIATGHLTISEKLFILSL